MQESNEISQLESSNQKISLSDSSLALVKTFIHSNYAQVKSLMAPEIRKWIFSSTYSDHLQTASSIIFKLLNPDLISDCKSYHLPSLISFQDYLLKCSSCTSSSEQYHTISTPSELHDFYLNSIKTLETSSLTKFEYKSSFYSLPIHAKYIHIQNILSLKTVKSFRCCTCCELLSVGSKTGVKTSCEHFTCVSCSISQQPQRCKICNLQFDLMPTYLESIQMIDLKCSASSIPHSLVSTTKKTFKLICGHLACDSHLKTENCSTCGFLFKKSYKICEKAENLRNFVQVFCSTHKKPVNRFKVFDCSVFCPDCFEEDTQGGCLEESGKKIINDELRQGENDISRGICNDFSIFFFVFHSYCEMLFENLKDKNRVISARLLKRLSFAKLLNGQDLYNLIKEISEILFPSSSKNILRVQVFKEVTTKTPGSKVFQLKNEKELRVSFKLKTPMVLVGLILAGTVCKSRDSLVETIGSSPVWITIHDSLGMIFEYEYLGELTDEQNDVIFDKKVSLLESVEYSLMLKLKGLFLYGKPFSRQKIREVQFIKNIEKAVANIDPLMGSPFLGFLFNELETF